MQKAIVAAYHEEVELAQTEGYKAPSFEDFDEQEEFIDEAYIQELQRRQQRPDEAKKAQGGGVEQGA